MMIDAHAAVIIIVVTVLTTWIVYIHPLYRATIERRADKHETSQKQQVHLYQMERNIVDLKNIEKSAQRATERISILMAKAEVQSIRSAREDC